MEIVIIGDGKVGYKLAKQLSVEDYDVVMIDGNEKKLRYAVDRLDIACVAGDGVDAEVQKGSPRGSCHCVHLGRREQYAELSDRKAAGSKAHDRTCAQSDLFQPDRPLEGGSASEYVGKSGTDRGGRDQPAPSFPGCQQDRDFREGTGRADRIPDREGKPFGRHVSCGNV